MRSAVINGPLHIRQAMLRSKDKIVEIIAGFRIYMQNRSVAQILGLILCFGAPNLLFLGCNKDKEIDETEIDETNKDEESLEPPKPPESCEPIQQKAEAKPKVVSNLSLKGEARDELKSQRRRIWQKEKLERERIRQEALQKPADSQEKIADIKTAMIKKALELSKSLPKISENFDAVISIKYTKRVERLKAVMASVDQRFNSMAAGQQKNVGTLRIKANSSLAKAKELSDRYISLNKKIKSDNEIVGKIIARIIEDELELDALKVETEKISRMYDECIYEAQCLNNMKAYFYALKTSIAEFEEILN